MERALAQLAAEETDRVAAEGLGERERDVGVLQDRAGVGQVLGRHGDTDAHRDRDVVAGDVRLAREHAEDALGEAARLGGAAAVEDAELVAAQAAHGAARPDDVAQHAREVAQHLVADLGREDVVDVLEALDVHHQHGEVLAVLAPLRQLVLEQLEEVAPVRHARQHVVAIEVAEARLELLHPRHVSRRGEKAVRALLALAHRGDVLLDHERRAVLPPAAHGPAIGPAVEHGAAHLLEGRVFRVPGEPASAARGEQLVGAIARRRLHRLVDVLDPALAVDDRDEDLALVDALGEPRHPDLAAAPPRVLALQQSERDEHDESGGGERDGGQVTDRDSRERRVSSERPGGLVGGESGEHGQKRGEREDSQPSASPPYPPSH
jgi:hypothetical protein